MVINGPSGEGIDLFFSLPMADAKDTYLVYVEQRKRRFNSLGVTSANGIIDKAISLIPDELGANIVTAAGLFNVLPHFSSPGTSLPLNSLVVAYEQTKKYHGSFYSHPASSPYVYINQDHQSAISIVLKGSERNIVAKAVCSRRDARKFETLEEFRTFVEGQGVSVNPQDEARLVF